MSIDIGRRLQLLRTARGLSQRELARRAGVTNATISLIESEKMNPSVGALKRVLDGIPIGLSDFFAFSPSLSGRYFYERDDMVEIGKGNISYRQVGERLNNLQVLHEIYQPGADTGRVRLQHNGEEGGVVIAGCLEVTVGQQRRILRKGQAYLFDSKLPHRYRNVGDEVCEVISACTPPTF